MVSQQETARALLTPGEVMQLPATDQLVLVSGCPPIRAKKLRYFKDRTFTDRVIAPPVLGEGAYADCPKQKPHDWVGHAAKVDLRLESSEDRDDRIRREQAEPVKPAPRVKPIQSQAPAESPPDTVKDDGGLQQQRHPGLEKPARKPAIGKKTKVIGIDQDDHDPIIEKMVMDQARAPDDPVQSLGVINRGFGLEQGGAPDLGVGS